MLFETPVWVSKLDLDVNKILEDVLEFSASTKNTNRSNIGGYQGDEYLNQELFEEIGKHIPRIEEKPLSTFKIHSWVNINKQGHYNKRHTHLNTSIFLSGVYYLKAPKNCGDIKFYDPRGAMMPEMMDHQYFYDSYDHSFITPKENLLIFFPPWLEHDVNINTSEEDRISISFNIFVEL